MADQEESKISGINAYEFGILTSRVQGVIERIDRMDAGVSRQMVEFKSQLTEFGSELRRLAEGYIRREEFMQFKSELARRNDKLDHDIDTIAELVRAAAVKTAGQQPYMSMLQEAVKWLLIIGVAVYTGHELPKFGP